jgi:hypothetical protein
MMTPFVPALSADLRAVPQDAEIARVSSDNLTGSVEHFVKWLGDHDDINTDKISRRVLLALYGEFCDFHDLQPLSPGRFDRRLKSVGFQRVRLSGPGRPWRYSLKRPRTVCKLKQPRARTVPHLRNRRET